MWLIKVGYSSEHEGHQIYQCKVCNTKLLVPIVELPNSNSNPHRTGASALQIQAVGWRFSNSASRSQVSAISRNR
jgi:hypothetical protein